MSTSLVKNRLARATASLRTAKLLSIAAAAVQLTLLLPAQLIVEYKLYFLIALFSGLLGVIAFRITHREEGQSIDAFRGLDALGASGRSARRQTELSLSLLIYLGFFVPLFNLVLIAWTFIKAHLGVRRIEAGWMQYQQREERAARLRGG